MSVQTSYTTEHAALYAGMVRGFQPSNAISKLNKGTVSIPFGLGVVTDGDNGAKVPVAGSTAAQFNGVVMYELNRAQQDNVAAGAIAGYDMTVIAHGQVAVLADVAITKDDSVFMIVGNGTGTKQGTFSNVIGAAGTLAVQIVGAKWVQSVDAGKVGFISIGIGG